MDDVSREECREVFRTFDANGDGGIGRDELQKIMQVQGLKVDKEQLEHLFQEIDRDGSGEIDFDEFLEIMSRLKKMGDDWERAFRIFDHDKDGFISVSDLMKVFERMREPICKANAEEMITAADVDLDGMLNLEEFKLVMKRGVFHA